MFDLSGRVLSLIGDDATYNGSDIKALIDKDTEVESEGGVFMRKTLAHIESGITPVRGDQIIHSGTTYSVESPVSDDGDMLVLEVRKL